MGRGEMAWGAEKRGEPGLAPGPALSLSALPFLHRMGGKVRAWETLTLILSAEPRGGPASASEMTLDLGVG